MKKIFILLILTVLVIPSANSIDMSAFDSALDVESFTKELNLAPVIVGDDDREEITNENAQDLEKAVLVLRMVTDESIAFCSGALVGPNVVLTAAHCLVSEGKYRKNVEVFAVAADKSKNGQFLSAKSISLYAPKEYIDLSSESGYSTKSETYDYGIVVLDTPIGLETGWFELNNRSTPRLKFANIIVMGRPGDKPTDTLWKSEGSIGFWEVYNNDTFNHNADTLPGSSGGPIVLKRRPDEIIGINISNKGGAADHVPDGYPNTGLRITNDIIKAVQMQSRRSGQYLAAK